MQAFFHYVLASLARAPKAPPRTPEGRTPFPLISSYSVFSPSYILNNASPPVLNYLISSLLMSPLHSNNICSLSYIPSSPALFSSFLYIAHTAYSSVIHSSLLSLSLSYLFPPFFHSYSTLISLMHPPPHVSHLHYLFPHCYIQNLIYYISGGSRSFPFIIHAT